jgi:hypothetical protein
MNPKYPRRKWTLRRRIALVLMILVGVFTGAAGLLVYIDMRQDGAVVQGKSLTVAQAMGTGTKKLMVNEPLFNLELPGDWKEQTRTNLPTEHSITWQATKKNEDNRSLKIYLDTPPATQAVNKILPVTVQGSSLALGEMSDNCVNFTSGGSMDPKKAVQNTNRSAKWGSVDFICDTGSVFDNKIGVGAPDGLNQIVMTGQKGAHKYFFLYIDRNIHPDNSILTNALESFRVK